ncbi:MAG: dolichol kinase [Desulfurococcaceae archaeon]|nr:dolichol kinase [Desulfurococcaceae archaeon]MCC6058023.1 dolichol kinase [Desulfurococcaceae archaeon]
MNSTIDRTLLMDIAVDIVKAIPLFIYILLLVYMLTKKLYFVMVSKGLRHNVAVYFNRKIIHILSGGVIALLVPYLFKEPFVPMVFAYILAIATYLPHKKRQILNWFQTEDNMYEVNFCIAWGTTIALLWILTNNPWISILPALAISFGDAVTGIVRNIVFGYRTKHWIGNIAMAILMIPIGYSIAGAAGALSMVVASAIERIEVNPVDDNLLISFSVAAILTIWYIVF